MKIIDSISKENYRKKKIYIKNHINIYYNYVN